MLLALPAQLPSAPLLPLDGNWVNQDSATGSLTALSFKQDQNGRTSVRIWAKCAPADCDLGEAPVLSLHGLLTSTLDAGFEVTNFEFIVLPDRRLVAVYTYHFKDNSGRADATHIELFVPENSAPPDPATAAAQLLLQTVAATYRTISTGRFAWRQQEEHSDARTTRRIVSTMQLAVSNPGKSRFEIRGNGEPTISVSDGTNRWLIFPAKNEYVAVPPDEIEFASSIVDIFRLLDGTRQPARIAGTERVAGRVCTKVEIGWDAAQVQTVWVDPRTNMVLKYASRTRPATGSAERTEIVAEFSIAEANEPVDSASFTFNPASSGSTPRHAIPAGSLAEILGTPAPEFSLADVSNKQVQLKDLRGSVVLLEFWSSWCVPCRASMPVVELLHRQFATKGLRVLGVNDEEPSEQLKFLRENGYSFRFLFDPDRSAWTLYHIEGIPTSILIDREGKIRAYDLGGAGYDTLRAALRNLGVD